MATMKLRSIKMSDEVWNPAKERAAAEGIPLAVIIRNALIAYGKGN